MKTFKGIDGVQNITVDGGIVRTGVLSFTTRRKESQKVKLAGDKGVTYNVAIDISGVSLAWLLYHAGKDLLSDFNNNNKDVETLKGWGDTTQHVLYADKYSLNDDREPVQKRVVLTATPQQRRMSACQRVIMSLLVKSTRTDEETRSLRNAQCRLFLDGGMLPAMIAPALSMSMEDVLKLQEQNTLEDKQGLSTNTTVAHGA